MRGLLKRPIVVVALTALFGVVTWQTGSILAVLGLLTLGHLGWNLAKGAPLSSAITMPVAAWAAGLGIYNPLVAGAPISAVINTAITYVACAMYLIWAVPLFFRRDGFSWDTYVKLAIGLVVIVAVIGTLSKFVPGA